MIFGSKCLEYAKEIFFKCYLFFSSLILFLTLSSLLRIHLFILSSLPPSLSPNLPHSIIFSSGLNSPNTPNPSLVAARSHLCLFLIHLPSLSPFFPSSFLPSIPPSLPHSMIFSSGLNTPNAPSPSLVTAKRTLCLSWSISSCSWEM